jgi:hypothetical protein
MHTKGRIIPSYISGHISSGSAPLLPRPNAALSAEGQRKLFCSPDKLNLVDDQYVRVMRDFLKKVPAIRKETPSLVLLLALQATFPCK